MKCGFIARADNSGLGTLSWEFANHLKPDKVLLVQNGVFQVFPERYAKFETITIPAHKTISRDTAEEFLSGIDVLLSIETFYNWTMVILAREMGVKTALITMCEMYTEDFLSERLRPDLFICPSKLDYQMFPEPKIYLPPPVNTEKLVWRKRTKPRLFIHPSSHGGVNLRKGTPLLLEAMKYVNSDIRLIIYTWRDIFSTQDKRVEIKKVNFENYWQIWEKGDILVYPQDYNGICLPVDEAFASGLGVITTDIFPFNTYLPKDLLFQPKELYRMKAFKGGLDMLAAKISPQVIAQKIDEVAKMESIEKYSLMGKKWSGENSWQVLLPKYEETLQDLCDKKV